MIDTTKLLVLKGSDAARSAKIGISESPPDFEPSKPPLEEQDED